MIFEDQINQIEKDISYQEILKPNYGLLDFGWQQWKIGDRIGWLYKEDFEFYKKELIEEIREYNSGKGFLFSDTSLNRSRFQQWLRNFGFPYSGILFTFPEKRFCIHDTTVICMDRYPIEKDNPVCDWVSFNRFLQEKSLYKVYKI